jgi:REP element-mobilizing transposase RayT
MVLASHVIFGAYGFWLPNDPRGSWSEFVGAWELYRRGGHATKINTRRSVAHDRHDRDARGAAKGGLKYPPVVLNEPQRHAVGNGFGKFAEKNGLAILACAVLPDHFHLVIARDDYAVEQAVTLLKGAATRELEAVALHPMASFPRVKGRLAKCFGRGEWKVFLDDPEEIPRAIGYVDDNPGKAGLPRQHWPFVRDDREQFS